MPWVAGAFVVCAAACVWTLLPRTVVTGNPVAIGNAGSVPQDIRRRDGAWIWIERPDNKPARLMRGVAGQTPGMVAEAGAIAAYDTNGKIMVWSQRTGKIWSVLRAGDGASTPAEL